MSNWKPGQRLNTAEEVMQALLDGQKIHPIWHPPGSTYYLHLVDGELRTRTGAETSNDICDPRKYCIYTPPKRKVTREVTVWVNVYPDDDYRVFNNKSNAEFFTEDALAVAVPHTLTIEVEVSE
jgi:hypothetical protein